MDSVEPARPGTRTGSGVKSALRTLELLELLASGSKSFSLAEIHRELGHPKSSLLELLRTLVSLGWVDLDDSGRYGIGLSALLAGSSFLDRDPTARFAGGLLHDLQEELGETVHLARLDQSNVVYLVSRESPHHARRTSRVGRRLPAHVCALGKALLAGRDDLATLLPDELPRRTDRTITSIAALEADLALTLRRGFAREAGESTPDTGCLAVVVPATAPLDALSCSLPLDRLPRSGSRRESEIVTALDKTARRLAELVELAAPTTDSPDVPWTRPRSRRA